MQKIYIYIVLFALFSLTVMGGNAPFIKVNEIHYTRSEFQFNLILNQNRNTPIMLVQYSENKTEKIMKPIVQNALWTVSDIAFALFVDCRQFSYDMNKSLTICYQFDQYQKTKKQQLDEEEDSQKLNDPYFRFQFFSPNPTRIKEKGHIIAKSHDSQNLRDTSASFNSQYLAKIIRNEIPDFVTYIEDQRDLEDFLQTNSQFRLSKGPKLLYFDQNLQSPLFIKKLAVSLDGWFKVGVSDSPRMAGHFRSSFDELIILEYDFETKKYEHSKITFKIDNEMKSILQNKLIKSYTDVRKPRDMLLDFQHKEAQINNISSLKQINQLISHGRIIVLQASNEVDKYDCPQLYGVRQKYSVMFNYVCFGRENLASLLTKMQADTQRGWKNKLFLIDSSLRSTKLIENTDDLYQVLPKAPIRQTITTQKDSHLCLQAAKASQKQPVLFYFNQKTHAKSLNLLRYFNSLQQVNSLLYFCQFFLPDEDVKTSYQITQNTIFTMSPPNQRGESKKLQHQKMQEFISIKMFLREISLTKILRIYQQKIVQQQVHEITSAQDLTQKCFSQKCIIALIETDTFHQQSELSILSELQIQFSDEDLKFYWIDGICHFEVGKQLKLAEKGSKLIQRSYLILYNQKTYQYAAWKGNKLNKFWQKKDVFRWVKSLRNPENVSKLKFGIDFQNRKCIRKAEEAKVNTTQKNQSTKQKKKSKKQVNADEL